METIYTDGHKNLHKRIMDDFKGVIRNAFSGKGGIDPFLKRVIDDSRTLKSFVPATSCPECLHRFITCCDELRKAPNNSKVLGEKLADIMDVFSAMGEFDWDKQLAPVKKDRISRFRYFVCSIQERK